ncbi:MAG TPA: hypothetical protein VN624_04410 [Rhodanobacter sp.]|nr:hypothetical protein [Rhodanobacter sp.]
MKYESLMLRCLFLACLAICGLIFAAMVTITPAPDGGQLAASSHISAILLAAPSTCALLPDGVVCPRLGG